MSPTPALEPAHRVRVEFTGHIPDEFDPVAVCLAKTACFREDGTVIRAADFFNPKSVGPVESLAPIEFIWTSYGPHNLLIGFTIEIFTPPGQLSPLAGLQRIEHEFDRGMEFTSLYRGRLEPVPEWTMQARFRILQGGRLFTFHGPTMTGGDTGNDQGEGS
ncbi:MAG: hypothetical protein SFV18_10210 [Bryobacteraceae bacterium]|nr:hypothetical protein [Bryobacteraceae bacterium]